MSARTAFPPNFHHVTKTVTPKEAQEQLAAMLAKTSTAAHLHPDAILSQDKIQFPAQSGPQGGLALHHLRRIEAGLRGENLVAESREELKALFSQEDDNRPASNDARLDAIIGGKRARKVEDWQDGAQDPEEYAQEQTEVDEEIGSTIRTGNQMNAAPTVQSSTGGKTDEEKAARKAAKKAKKKEAKKQKLTAG